MVQLFSEFRIKGVTLMNFTPPTCWGSPAGKRVLPPQFAHGMKGR
jgi:hypothetical protein